MIRIKGIELDEVDDLEYNLDKIRHEIHDRYNFWKFFDQFTQNYELAKGGLMGAFFKAILFIGVFPKFLGSLFQTRKVGAIIREAEEELIRHYELPENKVRRFRLQCQQEREEYEKDLASIKEELDKLAEKKQLTHLNEQIQKEIGVLIEQYQAKKQNFEAKLAFYQNCELKLQQIEDQILVKKSLVQSKRKLQQMQETGEQVQKEHEIQTEFELYAYYGEVLNTLSDNFKKIEEDKEEQLEELELNEMLKQIKVLR